MLIDSNIIIYSAQPESYDLRRFLADDFRWITQLILLNPFDLGG